MLTGWRYAVAASVCVGLLNPVAVAAPAGAAQTLPAAQVADQERSVEGRPIPVAARVPGAEDRPNLAQQEKAPFWPKAVVAEVDLSTAAKAAGTGLPVWVGPVQGAPEKVAPEKVRVEVLDPAVVAKLGGTGLGARLSRADGINTAGRVRLELDYSGFVGAFSAGYADRLKVVAMPAHVARCGARSPGMRPPTG
jgi:hypothetical protein